MEETEDGETALMSSGYASAVVLINSWQFWLPAKANIPAQVDKFSQAPILNEGGIGI